MAENNSNSDLKNLIAAISTGGKQTDNTAAMMVDVNIGSNIEKILSGLQEFAILQTNYLKQLAFKTSKLPTVENSSLIGQSELEKAVLKNPQTQKNVSDTSNLENIVNSINNIDNSVNNNTNSNLENVINNTTSNLENVISNTTSNLENIVNSINNNTNSNLENVISNVNNSTTSNLENIVNSINNNTTSNLENIVNSINNNTTSNLENVISNVNNSTTSNLGINNLSSMKNVLDSINKFASIQTDYLKQIVSYFTAAKKSEIDKSVTTIPQAQRGTFTTSFAESAGNRAGSLVAGGFGMGSLLENLGSTLGGTAGSIAGIGVGIAGLLVSLAGADWAAKQLGDGAALKNLIINLGEGLSSLDTQALASLGILVGTSALFAANTSFGNQFKTATGMTALGIGIGGFLAGIASMMDLAQFVGVDGSGVKTQLTNIAEGLNAFNTQSLIALGSLLGAGAVFGLAPAIAGGMTVGLSLIGVGIGGFIAGLVGATDAAKALGADGSGLKSQLTNIAAGMNALGGVEWSKIGSAGDALSSLGIGMGLFFGAQGTGVIYDILSKVEERFNWLFGIEDNESPIQQMVDSLKPINDLSDDMITKMDNFGAAIGRFVSSFESLANIKSGGITTNLESMLRGIGALLDAQKPLINGGTWYGQRWGWGDDIYFGEEGEGGLKNLTDENVNIIKDGVSKLYTAMGIPMPVTPMITAPSAPENPIKNSQPSIILAPINGPAGQPSSVMNNSNNTTTTNYIQQGTDPSGSLMYNQMLGNAMGDIPY